MPFKKPILSDFGVCARYLPMQSALQQVFGSYDKAEAVSEAVSTVQKNSKR